jgi:pimeloyl-ACP methyl ester carboxylesterase
MPEVSRQLRLLAPKPHQPHHSLFVYLPGMDGTGQLFYRQAEALSPFFDIRCLAIPADDLSDWDTLSTQAIELIAREMHRKKPPPRHSCRRKVYLCGESFGGCLALKMAVKAPELFERLILINPASAFQRRPWLHWGVPLTRWMPDFLHRSSTLGFLPFLAALNNLEKRDRRALLSAMNSLPPATVSWRLSLLANFVLQEQDVRALTQPILAIASQGDRLLPSVEEASGLVKRLPQARMVVLPQSGHACLLEKEVKLYQILKKANFLEASDLSRAKKLYASSF